MKIVKKPNKLPLIQCKDCGVVLKIKYKDIGLTATSSFYIECPICHQWNVFKNINEIAYKGESNE